MTSLAPLGQEGELVPIQDGSQWPNPSGLWSYLQLQSGGILKVHLARQWWLMPLIPALGRQKKVDLYKFEDSLIYRERESSRIAKATTEKP